VGLLSSEATGAAIGAPSHAEAVQAPVADPGWSEPTVVDDVVSDVSQLAVGVHAGQAEQLEAPLGGERVCNRPPARSPCWTPNEPAECRLNQGADSDGGLYNS